MIEVYKILKDEKGSSYVSLIVTLVILLTIVSMIGSFNLYFSNHRKNINKHMTLSQEINNHIAEVYNSKQWELLDGEEIETKYGKLVVNYEYKGQTEYSTNQLDIVFTLGEDVEKYSLERSVYHE